MFTFKRVKPVPKNNKDAQVIADRLEGFLNRESPQLVYWLYRLFEDQQNAITYAELREAMLSGYEQQIYRWQEDYAKFVNEKLSPMWGLAIRAGASQLQDRFKEFILDDSDRFLKEWMRQHTADFVTNIGEDTRAAIKAILAHGQDEGWTAQQMAQAVRPCVGLTRPDALANNRYREHVRETLLKNNPGMRPDVAAKRAYEAALKYGEKQHRARAEMIANTELAFAYNRGYHEGVRQAMAQGLMGPCVKVWRTAGTNRVCDKCLALNGQKIGFEDSFNIAGRELYRGMHQVPPAHPRCRCVVQYVEYAPPARKAHEFLRVPEAGEAEKALQACGLDKIPAPALNLINKHMVPENIVVDHNFRLPVAYEKNSDKFYLNPSHSNLPRYDMGEMLTHEIIHRLDSEFALSYMLLTELEAAIETGSKVILSNRTYYEELMKGPLGEDMCLSDIFSALTDNAVIGSFFHETSYWYEVAGRKEWEILANLLAIHLNEKVACEEVINGIPPLKTLYKEALKRYGELQTFGTA